jgi:GNAT superfamily N-acetyltransferase
MAASSISKTAADLCSYCACHKLKADIRSAGFGKGKCLSCGERLNGSRHEAIGGNGKCKGADAKAPGKNEGADAADPLKPAIPPVLIELLPTISKLVFKQAAQRGVILGGASSERAAEIAAFWLKFYGHPPDGKNGWYVQPFRLLAYDRDSHSVVGGIHWQNPKAAKLEGSKGGYISALAVSDEVRGRGIGKLLVVAAVQRICLDGSSMASLVTTQFGHLQTPGLDEFYFKLGFTHKASKGLPPRPPPEPGQPALPPRAGLFILEKIPKDYGEEVFGVKRSFFLFS